jgi:flavin-binding protein dodecin
MPQFEYKVYDGDPGDTDYWLRATDAETQEFRGKVYVGVSATSFEDAIENAWRYAQEVDHLVGPKYVRVLEEQKTVGNDHFRVYVIINAG